MSGLELYIMFVLIPNVQVVFSLLGVMALVIYTALNIAYSSVSGKLLLHTKKIGAALCAIILIAAALPDRQQMAFILGVSAVTQIEGASKIPEKTIELLNKYIEEGLQE